MKTRHRIWAACTALVLTAAALTGGVFAASDEVRPVTIAVTNVYGSPKTKTMVPGASFTVDYRIRPEDADVYLDVTFDSSDYRIADVDDYGYVTANEPGECTITLKTGNRKSDTFIVRVLGKADEGYDTSGYISRSTGEQDTDPVRSSQSSASSKTSSSSTSSGGVYQVKLSSKLDRDTLVKSVRTAGGKTPTLVNYKTVSADSLRAAGEEGATAIQFDTKSDKTVIGRLTVYPQNAADMQGDLKVGVHCNTSSTSKVDKNFADYYKNDFRIVLIDQRQFHMPVKVAVKVGGLSGKNLKFYGYDAVNNNYYDVKVTNAKIDSKGYLHFYTEVGGYLIVSDGTLKIK